MTAHSSILTWRIPWREEPGRLQSTGSPGITDSKGMSLSKLGESEGQTGQAGVLQSVGSQRVGQHLATEQ